MKKFETPTVEVVEFAVEDVITASTTPALPPLDGGEGQNCI